MFRPASRILLRAKVPSPATRASVSRRFLSTANPAQKPRSWKSSAVRWGLAATAVFYYSTHDVFAEDPAYAPVTHEADHSENLPTIEQIAAQRRQRLIDAKNPTSNSVQAAPLVETAPDVDVEVEHGSIEDLEEEAGQQGAFNPETGEINWDCPCLGGMAHGPCGEEFKAAFSCFVYSTEEPKGMDCIDKFKGMQDCFRQYPDIYGAELEDDEEDMSADELETPASTTDNAVASTIAPESQPVESASKPQEHTETPTHSTPATQTPQIAKPEEHVNPSQESGASDRDNEKDEEIPKVWHDARGDSEGK